MKEYETLTREKVDVVPFGCGMPETHLMQDWSDKMLDRITGKTTVRCVRQGRELPREEIAAIFEPDEEGGEQE